jgi:phosphoenolpyruvate carboxykinase (GTP)
MAATMGSETTAAAAGQQGVVRRDPFAMLPFCGYNMAHYIEHWLQLGERLQASGATLPRIFCVNWFRKGDDGRFVWPGFGENMRVLAWMLGRVDGRAEALETAFGHSPRYDDLTWEGLDFARAAFDNIMNLDAEHWQQELALHEALFEQLAQGLPQAMPEVKARIEARLGL